MAARNWFPVQQQVPFLCSRGVCQVLPHRRAVVPLNRLARENSTAKNTTAAAGPAIVEFNNATIRQPGGTSDLYSALNFTINPGDVWAIVGPVASGKSTLLEVYFFFSV
jgi:ABC-type molybdenum transport system ATPase subunit/photorepair protein PhrA